MRKKDRQDWQKRKRAEDAGYDPKPWEGVIVHSQNTERHEFVKFVLAYVLDEMGRDWATESQMDDGRVVEFDFGPTDGEAVVYEVETDVTPARAREKAAQYAKGPVRDMIPVDPDDVPARFDDAIEYVRDRVVIG